MRAIWIDRSEAEMLVELLEQSNNYLAPMLDGEIRAIFGMSPRNTRAAQQQGTGDPLGDAASLRPHATANFPEVRVGRCAGLIANSDKCDGKGN